MNIDLNNLPEELVVTVYAYYNADFDYVSYRDTDSVNDSTMLLISEPLSITFKTLDRDALVSKTVDSLKEDSKKIRADAEVRCKLNDEKINSLLALECKS